MEGVSNTAQGVGELPQTIPGQGGGMWPWDPTT